MVVLCCDCLTLGIIQGIDNVRDIHGGNRCSPVNWEFRLRIITTQRQTCADAYISLSSSAHIGRQQKITVRNTISISSNNSTLYACPAHLGCPIRKRLCCQHLKFLKSLVYLSALPFLLF